MFRCLLVLALVMLFAPFCAAQVKQSSDTRVIALTHITIVNVAAQDSANALRPDQIVVVTANRITAVGRMGSIKLPKGARVIDATGKYLIPGLWDMHVHLFNNSSKTGTNNKDAYFPLFLANGVTGVRDMWTDFDDLKLVRQWVREFEAGTVLGPRVA